METNWPQLLQDLGPFALLPFTALVLERIAYSRAKDPKLPASTRNWVYATAWVVIFALCGLVVYFWLPNRPKSQEAMMRGRIHGLSVQHRLRATGPDAAHVRVFTYRDPQQVDQLYWRTFSADPLGDKSEIVFLLDLSTRDSEETLRFPFRTSTGYYARSMEVSLRYDAARKRLVFENSPAGRPEEIEGKPVVLAQSSPPPRAALPWFASVLAQSSPTTSAVLARLESDDPLIRLTARKQLASLGPAAVPDIDRALSDLDSSYRIKLGVIVAANQMPALRPASLSTASWCEVWRSSQTGDETIKSQAGQLLKKQPTPINPTSCRTLRLRDYQFRTAQELKVYTPVRKK